MSDSAAKNSRRCLNCRTTLTGKFCHECGQEASAERYSFRSFTHEFFHSFSAVSSIEFFRTFYQLVRRPGHFLRYYLAGKRVGYVSPIKYFFYAAVVEVSVRSLLIWLTHDPHLAQEGVRNLQLQVLDFFSTIFWGLLWWFFYRRSDFNLTENSVCAVYFVAQMNFYSMIFLVLSAPIISHPDFYTAMSVIELIAGVTYSFFFARRLFRDPFWKVIPKQIILTLILALLVVAVRTADIFAQHFLAPAQ